MSNLIRHGKSASKLATALCLISSGAVSAGEIAPTLVKTTTPIRVRSAAIRTTAPRQQLPPAENALPENALPENALLKNALLKNALLKNALLKNAAHPDPTLQQVSGVNPGLRVLLEPDRPISLNPHLTQKQTGAARTNQFVELQAEHTIDRTRTLSTARSAAVPQRKNRKSGSIQTNPLVVDAPPKLRRFGVNELPLMLPTTDPADSPGGALVIREQPLPQRPIEDLDQTLDMLSVQQDDTTMIRGAARNRGFGMLAIDQIGRHLDNTDAHEPAAKYPPPQRFANDLVLPDGPAVGLLSSELDGSLRQQLGSFKSNNLIENDDPTLPRPGQSTLDPPANASVEIPGANALEVEELLAASSMQPETRTPEPKSEQPPAAEKPSLVQRFSSWSRNLSTKSPSSSRNSSSSKSVSTRIAAKQTDDDLNLTPKKRSGGILTRWLSK